MKSLLELYAPSLQETGNRQMKLSDFPDDAQVEWDRVSQEKGITGASFIERSGRFFANTRGKGWFEWTGTTWQPTEKPGPKTGPEVSRNFPNWRASNQGPNWHLSAPREQTLWDVFSTDFTGYRNNITRAADRLFGEGWQEAIESAYPRFKGKAVATILSQCWRNLWTDHEALMEVGHYFDVAQQALAGNLDYPGNMRSTAGPGNDHPTDDPNEIVAGYALRIGPRYDVPRDDDPGPEMWDEDSKYIRRKRVTDASYFDGMYGSA